MLPSAAIDGRSSLDVCLRLAIPWECVGEESDHRGGIFTWKWKWKWEWILSPLVRIEKLLISGIAGDGSAKASVVHCFVGWHGIGVAMDSAALCIVMSWCCVWFVRSCERVGPCDISVIEKGNTNNRKIYVSMTVLCVSTAFNLWEVITHNSQTM